MQPSKDPCIIPKGKLINRKGGGVGVRALGFWRLYLNVGKDGGWERVPVPWTHEDKRMGKWLARNFSKLTAKGCRESAKRVCKLQNFN